MPALPRSLPRICVALGLPTPSLLGHAAEREYKDGNTFLEFRLDYLPDPSAAAELIRTFRKRYPDSHILATCRHKQNKGHFSGPIEQQMAHLQNAAQAGAAAIDLEIESAERAKSALAALRNSASLLISYHNFENTPALDPILHRLERIPADAYKVATTARKPSDNLRILRFAREHCHTQLVAFCMSDIGTLTRVLGPGSGASTRMLRLAKLKVPRLDRCCERRCAPSISVRNLVARVAYMALSRIRSPIPNLR